MVTNKARNPFLWVMAAVLCLSGALILQTQPAFAADEATSEKNTATKEKAVKKIPNKRCMKCHGDEDEKTSERDDGTEINIFVEEEQFEGSVHGEQFCMDCHNTVKKAKHVQPLPKSVGCVECHQQKHAEQAGVEDPQYKRLDVVVEQIESYMRSVHARPNIQDQSKTNATCYDCHDAHNIGTIGSAARAEHRQQNAHVCGKCHEEQRDEYIGSVHGKEVLDKDNADAAVCSDCHTPHNIERTEQDATKLLITENCGDCHEKQVRTYQASYHGQVTRLGYTHTAKCYDCHDSHTAMRVDDPNSSVHENNRLETCRKCHEDAPENFVGFHAHGDSNDRENYPEMWYAARGMELLIFGVFAFFWTHLVFWFYREWKDRKEGKGFKHDTSVANQVYFRRFSIGWRIAHVVLAISIMFLVLTGTAVLFGNQAWAKTVMELMGGPQVAAVIHRIAATSFGLVLFGHMFVAFRNIYKTKKSFTWFGPTSMIPNWQDIKDVGLMFKWFLGFAPRPKFDRWSYWEKFDYWAPFWGMFIIGVSGLMLWFPIATATILPGWVFNIATIVHAEEAILAAIFLFTVHYFNAHFRPDKFPMDTVMITGAVPLEEFMHEHRKEYERLKETGELEKYLVKAPSAGAAKRARIITGILIVIGLSLVAMVLTGYVDMLRNH